MKFRLAAIAAFAATIALGQSFEVASIKPNRSGDGRVGLDQSDPIRMNARNIPLRMLITFAYDIREPQLSGGPAWLDSERWDVSAKLENPIPKTDEGRAMLRKMLQSLLEDRFRLKLRKESKEMSVSVLTVAKGGLKMKESVGDDPPQMRMGLGNLDGSRIAIPMLAKALSAQIGRTVTDGTDLKALYDVKLEFAPEPGGAMAKMGGPEHPEAANTDRPSLTTALQEQLGLKLETRKENVELFVVENAERPSEN